MRTTQSTTVRDNNAVLTKAFLRAGERLGLNNSQLAAVSGVSQSTISRMSHQKENVTTPRKQRECIILFLRLYRSLLPLAGDNENARIWLNSNNKALHGKPIDLITTVEGLVNAVVYVDGMRGKL